jgi:hypothetical protein
MGIVIAVVVAINVVFVGVGLLVGVISRSLRRSGLDQQDHLPPRPSGF